MQTKGKDNNTHVSTHSVLNKRSRVLYIFLLPKGCHLFSLLAQKVLLMEQLLRMLPGQSSLPLDRAASDGNGAEEGHTHQEDILEKVEAEHSQVEGRTAVQKVAFANAAYALGQANTKA